MSNSEGHNPWPMRVVLASIFTLMFGLVLQDLLGEMPGVAQASTLIALFGFGLLISMSNEILDKRIKRLQRKSRGQNPDE